VRHLTLHGRISRPVPGATDSEGTVYRQLLERGSVLVDRRLSRGPLTDDDFRYLHDTHGLPRELVSTLLTGQV
jgi:hypothetical protein